MESIFASDLVQEVWKILPFFIPVIAGLIICLIDLVWKEGDKDVLVYFAVVGVIGLIVSLWHFWMSSESCIYLGFAVSKFSLAIIIIVSVLALLLLLLGHQFYSERDPSATNFVVYLLFALFGALTALATSNLIMIFIGLVIVSIAVTNLVKLYGNRSGLAGLQKFWIYLLVTDLLFCLGAAFFFGATGTLEIGASSDLLGIINKAYTGNYFKIAIAILGVSLMAKMAIIPFHWWLLDFAGSNSLALTNVITVFYRTVMMLIFMKIFAPLVSLWGHFFEVPLVAIAIITMTWANLAAVRSSDLRQLFIYSSIAHVGYFLVLFPTLLVESSVGLIAMVVFIVAFSIIHLGSFAVLHLFSSEGSVQTNFADLNGLGRRQPWLCLVVCLFLFALAGSPPMVTFLVRLMILKEVVLSGNYYILGALIINMAIAIFYYLRPIANMFIVKSTKEAGTPVELSYSLVIVIAFSALVALYLGIQPTSFLHWIQLSIAGI